ncbi:SIMPL domain-containing protein, partial [Salmonella enterica]|uniref:SIMPL domain-containing protein n=4 Tax=Enterobacteriaceae TaxID=543 RepID=UPI00301E2295
PHLEKYPLAQAAYLIHKGETVKPASKANGSEAAYNYARLLAGESVNGKILVDDANYQLMIKDSEILGRLLDQEIVNGQRLIGEIPFNALEWIKANDQEAYQKAIEATTADLKAKAEEKLQAA